MVAPNSGEGVSAETTAAVLDKLGRLAGYLEGASDGLPALPPGLFCAGGSMGTLLALQLARHRHQPDVTTTGSNGDRLAVGGDRFVVDPGGHLDRDAVVRGEDGGGDRLEVGWYIELEVDAVSGTITVGVEILDATTAVTRLDLVGVVGTTVVAVEGAIEVVVGVQTAATADAGSDLELIVGTQVQAIRRAIAVAVPGSPAALCRCVFVFGVWCWVGAKNEHMATYMDMDTRDGYRY